MDTIINHREQQGGHLLVPGSAGAPSLRARMQDGSALMASGTAHGTDARVDGWAVVCPTAVAAPATGLFPGSHAWSPPT